MEYKYKVGDVLKVTGWVGNATPPIKKGVVMAALPVRDTGDNKVVPGYRLEESKASFYVLERWVEPLESSEEQTNCVCETVVLMAAGCRCGWIQKERAARA